MMMLSKKTALITGASRGIGRGIAHLFAEHGCFVGINFLKDVPAARKTEQIVKKTSDGLLLQGDVSDKQAVKSMVDQLVDERGSIDILVHNAGMYQRHQFNEISASEWKRLLEVNLSSGYYLCQQILPFMNKGGKIIFISSQLAFKGSSHGADYATSKAGMLGLMKSLALELADIPIYVNAVAPGTIDTDIIADYTLEMRKKREKQIPLGRLGTAEDIAKTCLFFASDLSDYVTGETLQVNGGLYIH